MAGPGTRLWAVSDISLSSLDAVRDGWSQPCSQRVDGKDRHDDQRHADDQSQPEQRRGAEDTERRLVLRVQRPHVRHEQVAEDEVEDDAAPHGDVVEHGPVPRRQTTLEHSITTFGDLVAEWCQTYDHNRSWVRLK